MPGLNKIDSKVIINIAGTKVEDYVETLEILEQASDKQVGYEINISCPNVKEGGQQFGVSSKLDITVDPVVVIPDILSKKASLKFRPKFERKKGILPKKATLIQAIVENKKAC